MVKGGELSLQNLLKTHKVVIPPYQRRYDWKKKTIETLLEDVQSHINDGGDKGYFLGNLLIHSHTTGQGVTSWNLVDGQQRLVSLTIITAYVRDALLSVGEYRAAYDLHEKLIWGKTELSPKLMPRQETAKYLRPFQALDGDEFEVTLTENTISELKEGTQDAFLRFVDGETVAKFPMPLGESYRAAPGVNIEVKAPVDPGNPLASLFGTITLETDVPDKLKFTLPSVRDSVLDDLKIEDSHWSRKLIPQMYRKTVKGFFAQHHGNEPSEMAEYYLTWKTALMKIIFTTTIFTDEADAIYYFGKLNDADTSLQLNAGDLMRYHVSYVVEKGGEDTENDDKLLPKWDEVEKFLKAYKKKDAVPDLLHHYLTAIDNRCSKKKTYSELKEFSKQWNQNDGTVDKKQFLGWLSQLSNWAKEFQEIEFPQEAHGGSFRLAYDSLDGVYEQHKSILLAGKMAFLPHNQAQHFKRLLSIVEFWVVKGVLFPGLTDDEDGIQGLPSNVVYQWIDETCGKLTSASKNYTKQISNDQATVILDSLATKVNKRCAEIWSTGTDWSPSSISELLFQNTFSQNRAKLILSTVEVHRMSQKKWDLDVEVEHIAPQTWNSEWNDEEKGGGFAYVEVKVSEKKDGTAIYGLNKAAEKNYGDLVQRLGNRTLLNPGSNKSLGNKSFLDKKQHTEFGYNTQAPSWTITQDVVEKRVWGPDEINTRSKELLKEFVQIFSPQYIGC